MTTTNRLSLAVGRRGGNTTNHYVGDQAWVAAAAREKKKCQWRRRRFENKYLGPILTTGTRVTTHLGTIRTIMLLHLDRHDYRQINIELLELTHM